MTRVAKEVVKAFYGKETQHSYFTGCSNGGRQALMEAQRFPEDYDGIIAGAPANFMDAPADQGARGCAGDDTRSGELYPRASCRR